MREKILRYAAFAVSTLILAVAVRACLVTERSLKLHLDPVVVCILDEHPERDHFLLFSVKNEGAISATNLVVDHVTLRYLKSEKKIRLGGGSGGRTLNYNRTGERWLFAQEFLPNSILSKLTGDHALRDAEKSIDVLVFNLSYYRESDGLKFSKRCIYYVDGATILIPERFENHPHYQEAVSETGRFLAEADVWFDPKAQLKQ